MQHYFIFIFLIVLIGVFILIRWKPILGGLAGTILIVALDCLLIINLIPQYESRTYPSTTGLIIQSTVTSQQTTSHANGFTTVHTTYGVDFKYRYEVNGRSFEATRYRYNSYSASHAWAQGVVAAHPVGSRVQVFYNPQNPADALLSTGLDSTDIILFLTLTIFNLLVAFLWWRWFGKRASRQPTP
ncbi:MAG TPA: DUF3592 domain-containing protein [Phycisphaerae bacterium]|nr:DUF3592 domain-containing protein [Phycisphaerae bacterium]